LNAASAQYAKFDEEKGSLNREAKDAKRALVTAEDKLGSLQGNREQINAVQANRGKESLNLRSWLEVPQNKGRFKRPVHGPIALNVVVDR
jgi:chromosome segregation ATPase